MQFVISSYKNRGNSLSLYKLTNGEIINLDNKNLISPSFVVANKDNIFTFSKDKELSLYSYKVKNNLLEEVSKIAISGGGITHLAYSNKNNILFGCSYSDGSYFSVSVKDGIYQKVLKYEKQITDSRLSRCHCVFLNNEENLLGVVNIALDAIYFYKIKGDDLEFSYLIELEKGIGPRHAIYNKDNSLIYVMTEYSNQVVVIDVKLKKTIQAVTTIPNFEGKTYGATLLISNDNKYLYASNRGEDSVAKFKIGSSGLLEYKNSFSVLGSHPRHMDKSKDGKLLISCNKDSNNVVFIDLAIEEVVNELVYDEASGICEIK